VHVYRAVAIAIDGYSQPPWLAGVWYGRIQKFVQAVQVLLKPCSCFLPLEMLGCGD
jgi:hypothetical protein